MIQYITARNLVVISAFISIFTSCNTDRSAAITQQKNTRERVPATDNLSTQLFTIQPDRDTLIKGKGGTVLYIYRNSFIDNAGKPVASPVEIALKEALNPIDIILSGLTTTTNGQYLETGGMIYLNASAAGQQLAIANNKFIDVSVPTASVKEGMKLFEGVLDGTGINWENPVPLLNDAPKAQNLMPKEADDSLIYEAVENDAFAENGIADSSASKTGRKNDFHPTENQTPKGLNQFQQDYRSNYIFSLKKLGWANIDGLCYDPRTKEIEFITNIENQKDFTTIYITLIISSKNMYLPGYQRKDETFSFTHNDEEPTRLPVGEKATILATAYKNDIPYYAIKTLTISEKQQVILQLKETTAEKLRELIYYNF